MNIGPYQFVFWPPIEVIDSERDHQNTRLTVELRRPTFWFEREGYSGIFRWRLMLGWLDVRRFAPLDEGETVNARHRGSP